MLKVPDGLTGGWTKCPAHWASLDDPDRNEGLMSFVEEHGWSSRSGMSFFSLSLPPFHSFLKKRLDIPARRVFSNCWPWKCFLLPRVVRHFNAPSSHSPLHRSLFCFCVGMQNHSPPRSSFIHGRRKRTSLVSVSCRTNHSEDVQMSRVRIQRGKIRSGILMRAVSSMHGFY